LRRVSIHRIFAIKLMYSIMTVQKKNTFTTEEQALADMAKALSHPARIAILNELARRNVCVCGEIVEVLPLAQSTVSQHLKELKKAGLINGTVAGVKSCYCINWEAFNHFKQIFNSFFTETQSTGCC
jgi:ArsR family transcriptional regulator, arsenate/arsenite/antimonite-responsive transcriptional repressor